MHESINNAAIKAFRMKRLSGVSLVANGSAFESGVKMLREHPDLECGVHLNLIEGQSLCEKREVETLLDEDGEFFNDVNILLSRLFFSKIKKEHIEIEIERQLDRVLGSGLNISYIDSHRHLHLFPAIYKIIHPILEKRKIDKMRFVCTPIRMIEFNSVTKVLAETIFRWTGLGARRFYAGPDYYLGFFNSGSIDKDILKYWLSHLSISRVYEIGFHLGEDDVALESFFQWKEKLGYVANWRNELNSLLSEELYDYFDKIILSRYESL